MLEVTQSMNTRQMSNQQATDLLYPQFSFRPRTKTRYRYKFIETQNWYDTDIVTFSARVY